MDLDIMLIWGMQLVEQYVLADGDEEDHSESQLGIGGRIGSRLGSTYGFQDIKNSRAS